MRTEVTEADFRMPEFKTAKLEDYERREDGKVVLKARWKNGISAIASVMGFSSRDGFEIHDVVNKVRTLAEDADPDNWESEDMPEVCAVVDLRLPDGSVLRGAMYEPSGRLKGPWIWQSLRLELESVEAWRKPAIPQ